MREQLRALREWSKIERSSLRARTGTSSDPMLNGNLGTKYRFVYGTLGDGPSKTMADRCRYYRQSPPPEDWDCVYEATAK